MHFNKMNVTRASTISYNIVEHTSNPSIRDNDGGSNPYEQGPMAILAWSLLYGLLVIVALAGNLGICWIILSVKKMRTVTNFFLCSTAFADCNVIVFNTVFNFTYAVNGNWYFGSTFCHFINFLPVASVYASILSITVISLDRFILVMYPMRRRTSRKTAKFVIAGIWFLALGVAFPQSYFAETMKEGVRMSCMINWPNSKLHLIYQIFFMVMSYWLPLITLAVSYVVMGLRLRRNNVNQIGYQNESQLRRMRSNKKAVRMMMLVVVVFAICWLPYQLYFLTGFINPIILHWTKIQQIYLAIFWLAMSSAMYNPFIYCWVNQRFRHQFKRIWSPGVKLPTIPFGSRRRSGNCSEACGGRINTVVVPGTSI